MNLVFARQRLEVPATVHVKISVESLVNTDIVKKHLLYHKTSDVHVYYNFNQVVIILYFKFLF